MKQRLRSLVLLAATASIVSSGCVKAASPLAPASADGTATFSGSVSSMAGVRIAGAHLTVLTGANKDTEVDTGADGRYQFEHLQTGSFSVLIQAPGFASITPKIDLFSDIDANFALSSSF
jgi:hypothetical protein